MYLEKRLLGDGNYNNKNPTTGIYQIFPILILQYRF